MENIKSKVLVVGGGPGGYVAAIRCGQLGLDTVLVEADRLGGTCLIRGCIPSKALIQASDEFHTALQAAKATYHGISLRQPPVLELEKTVAWKDGIVDRLSGGVSALLKRAKVRVVKGWGVFSDAKTCVVEGPEGDVSIQSEHIILATGSMPVELPFLPFGGKVISSSEALSLSELPDSVAIVGAGYIGLELGCALARFGTSITIVEAQDRILPLYDKALVTPVQAWLEAQGVTLHLSAEARGEKPNGLEIKTRDGNAKTVKADAILVTVGRRPRVDGWGRKAMALEMDGAFVKVDERCATTTTNVWAIGDLVGEPMLAHKASAQGEMVAEIIAGKRRVFDPVAIPAVCFTAPEIVSVGAGPETPNTINGVFPFLGNGRALSIDAGDDGGFVRVVADKDSHRVIGVQAVGKHVSEMSATFAHAIEMGEVLEDVAGIIHAHPTLSEAFHESALKALGHAIHI
jgi:dihydrolipoamide dehydrogenase